MEDCKGFSLNVVVVTIIVESVAAFSWRSASADVVSNAD